MKLTPQIICHATVMYMAQPKFTHKNDRESPTSRHLAKKQHNMKGDMNPTKLATKKIPFHAEVK